MDAVADIGVVAIGRNEGERLVACLRSLKAAGARRIVYVDSGSSDASVENARAEGAEVVSLDMSIPFTAARARNEGVRRLGETGAPSLIQFIDGDCTLAEGWLAKATAFLREHPDVAVVCGRRRERNLSASLYNRLCDIEWATPVGEAAGCGGDALMRRAALEQAGFYDETLIAGEEPELCLRLREKGWKIWRLDAEMTAHDAAMTRFSQWWKRARRAGHAYAEVSALHRRSARRIWARETRRALLWTGVAPAALLLAALASPWFLLLLLAYPAQAARLWLAARPRLGKDAAPWALLTVLGKVPETFGVLTYWWNRMTRRKAALIEYK